MRVSILSTFAGALGLAAITSAAPALPYVDEADACTPGITTVYVTPKASTITLHDAPTTTVYVGGSSAADPGESMKTLTYTRTLHPTFTLSNYHTVTVENPNSKVAAESTPSYDATVTLTTIVTVPYSKPTPSAEGSEGPISYYVTGTKTVYLNGHPPDSTESIVYLTNPFTVTVSPINEVSSTVADPGQSAAGSGAFPHTVTELGTQTIKVIGGSTITQHLSFPHATAPTGTGGSFTGIGSGGWNRTSVPSTVVGTGATDPGVGSTTLSAQDGFNPFGSAGISKIVLVTTHSSIAWDPSITTLSTLSAQSGFNIFTTPVYPSASTSTDPADPTDPTSTYVSSQAMSTAATNLTATSAASSVVVTIISRTSANASFPHFPVTASTASENSGAITSSSSSSIISTALASYGASYTTPASYGAPPPLAFGPPPSTRSDESMTLQSSTSIGPTSASSTTFSGSMLRSSSTTSSTLRSIMTATTASSAPTASSTSCGEIGDFVLNFDDIPPLAIGDQNPDTVTPPPVFSPYHQFDFSGGFVVVPPPTDPYLPSSGNQLTEFIPPGDFMIPPPSNGFAPETDAFSGIIGDGDHGLAGCFGFNFYGASIGCDSRGPDCDFAFFGTRYDMATGSNVGMVFQNISIPACPSLKNCDLTPVTLSSAFINLVQIRISLTVASESKIWFMDDLRMGWYNNTCEAGMCRQKAHIHKRQQ